MKDTIRAIAEAAAGAATFAAIVILGWLYMVATPEQRSAEADLYDHEVKAAAATR